jgi:hypothetical protein
VGRKNSGFFVPWWQKVRLGTLCHGGRKRNWEPCATVVESKDEKSLCHDGRK